MRDSKDTQRFDLVVIRIRKKLRTFAESKPCMHCLLKLNKMFGRKLRNIYYSTNEGKLICKSLELLLKEKNTYISSGNRRQMKICKKNHTNISP